MDELAHIEAFAAVAEARSFTRAAEALALPQPLLSRRVRSLERAWGGPVFDRGGRQITLTPLGELALPYARDVLGRARHLRQVVATAGASVVHLLGVPPGCPPAALARVIRTAAGHGLLMAVHEASAHRRAQALQDGGLAVALVRVAPESAPLRVALGLATVERLPGSDRALHLDALRPRRQPGRPAPGGPPGLLLAPEDELEPFADRMRRAVARAGLPEAAVRTVSSDAAAAAAVLAAPSQGTLGLLCDAVTAARHGLAWSPLADRALHRGYEVALAPGSTLGGAALAWLTPGLADALGARAPAGEVRVEHDPPPATALVPHG